MIHIQQTLVFSSNINVLHEVVSSYATKIKLSVLSSGRQDYALYWWQIQ